MVYIAIISIARVKSWWFFASCNSNQQQGRMTTATVFAPSLRT